MAAKTSVDPSFRSYRPTRQLAMSSATSREWLDPCFAFVAVDPELDLTIRGAISIARRLQDPLAELVKIEPKSIGVCQYQHDVHQPLLGKKLALAMGERGD